MFIYGIRNPRQTRAQRLALKSRYKRKNTRTARRLKDIRGYSCPSQGIVDGKREKGERKISLLLSFVLG
jgi:hypothetical protein